MLLTAFILTTPAPASSLKMAKPGDEVEIDTPFGPVSLDYARRACGADYIVIGTVNAVSSFEHVEGDDSRILSHMTLGVERAVHGLPPAQVVFTVPVGGPILFATASIAADADLPSAEELKQEMDCFCASQELDTCGG